MTPPETLQQVKHNVQVIYRQMADQVYHNADQLDAMIDVNLDKLRTVREPITRHDTEQSLADLFSVKAQFTKFINNPQSSFHAVLQRLCLDKPDIRRYTDLDYTVQLTTPFFHPFNIVNAADVWLRRAVDTTTGDSAISAIDLHDDWFQAIAQIMDTYREFDTPHVREASLYTADIAHRKTYTRNGIKHRGWTRVTYQPSQAYMVLTQYVEQCSLGQNSINTGQFPKRSRPTQ